MYAMTNTCLGFVFPIRQVAQFLANLAPLHWTIVKRIFRYIQATKNMRIKYDGEGSKQDMLNIQLNGLILIGLEIKTLLRLHLDTYFYLQEVQFFNNAKKLYLFPFFNKSRIHCSCFCNEGSCVANTIHEGPWITSIATYSIHV